MYTTLVPAYGKDYKSAKEVKEAWNNGRDFIISDMSHPSNGRYINKPQATKGEKFNVRYAGLRKIVEVSG